MLPLAAAGSAGEALWAREWDLHKYLLDRLIATEGDLPLEAITPDVVKRFEAALDTPHRPTVHFTGAKGSSLLLTHVGD